MIVFSGSLISAIGRSRIYVVAHDIWRAGPIAKHPLVDLIGSFPQVRPKSDLGDGK